MSNKSFSESEIREIMDSLRYDYRTLSQALPKAGDALLYYLQVGHTFDSLKIHLKRFKTYYMVSHDHTRATLVYNSTSQIWSKYWRGLEEEKYDLHDGALELRDLIADLGNCIKKGEQGYAEALEKMKSKEVGDMRECPSMEEEQKSQDLPKQRETPKSKKPAKKRESPIRFTTNTKEGTARNIYTLLTAQGYISNDTLPSDWLWICGIDTDIEPSKKQVDWLKGQNELVYFVYRMFREENENDLWAIASRVFTIKGKEQKSSSLRTANSKNNISRDKIVKLDKILRIR